MRLRSFTISNHARLEDLRIDVREHLVLVGPNDVGKSSVLRCLDLLLGATTAQLYGRLTAADLRNAHEALVIAAVFADLDDDDMAWSRTRSPSTGSRTLPRWKSAWRPRLEDGETLDIRRLAVAAALTELTARQIKSIESLLADLEARI